MGTGEGAIGQGEDGDDHEEDGDTDEASDNVAVEAVIARVPVEGSPGAHTNTNKHQHQGVRFVEELEADVVHRPLVDGDEVVRGLGTLRGRAVMSLPGNHGRLSYYCS